MESLGCKLELLKMVIQNDLVAGICEQDISLCNLASDPGCGGAVFVQDEEV